MKIPDPYIGMHMDKTLLSPQGSAEAEGKKTKLAEQASTRTTDQVHISDKARDSQRLNQLVAEVPEIRDGKVEALKKQISEQTYGADGRAVAAKIVESTLLDKIL